MVSLDSWHLQWIPIITGFHCEKNVNIERKSNHLCTVKPLSAVCLYYRLFRVLPTSLLGSIEGIKMGYTMMIYVNYFLLTYLTVTFQRFSLMSFFGSRTSYMFIEIFVCSL